LEPPPKVEQGFLFALTDDLYILLMGVLRRFPSIIASPPPAGAAAGDGAILIFIVEPRSPRPAKGGSRDDEFEVSQRALRGGIKYGR